MDGQYGRNGAPIPDKLKLLRACLSCKLIKTTEQWRENGCENCQEKYHGIDSINYTTPTFKGSDEQTKRSESNRARAAGRGEDVSIHASILTDPCTHCLLRWFFCCPFFLAAA